jgi:hypothetical protein
MTKTEALKLIEEHYGTLDQDEIYTLASDARVGTSHVEVPQRDGTSWCPECGFVDGNEDADPIFHPEQWL